MEPIIPKKIHYCWFGRKPLPRLARYCLDSWKTYLPDYELKRWDESNTDLESNRYMKEAYNVGKFAFVSDVVRLQVLYDEGGIYMDTDVEVVGKLDQFLHHKAFCGFQNSELLSIGVVGSKKGHGYINSLLDLYKDIHFLDDNGRPDLTPNTVRVTEYSLSRGLVLNNKKQELDHVTIYPTEFFCPKNYDEYHFRVTDHTCAIHHYAGSWYTPFTGRMMWIRINLVKRFLPFLDRPLMLIYNQIKKIRGQSK